MRPRLPLERAGQVLQPRLLLADGAATQRLERRQLVQLLSVDPVCLLRDGGGRAQWRREREQGSRVTICSCQRARLRRSESGGEGDTPTTILLETMRLRKLGLELGSAAWDGAS